MRVRRRNTIAIAMIALGLAAGGARADVEEPCSGGLPKVGDLGILSLDCDCSYSSHSHSNRGHGTVVRSWAFRSEPRVIELREGGPAVGRLREGDVITAIDGVLITTRMGGVRFSEVSPGMPVTLTVRREGREMPVRIVAGSVCPDMAMWPETRTVPAPAEPPRAPEAPAVTATPEVPEAPEAPQTFESPPRPPRAPHAPPATRLPQPAIPTEDALPRGWSGFALTCRSCGATPGEAGEPPVWNFGTLPTIYFVDPGSPAARAGIRSGDVLTEIDGTSLLSAAGGRRFGALRPGQSARWTIRRGGRLVTANVVTEPRPEETGVPLAARRARLEAMGDSRTASADLARAAADLARSGLLMETRGAAANRLRYAGAVGGSAVEVRGLGNVVVDDSGDEIVITTRDATIRIRPAAVQAASSRAGRHRR